MRKEKKKLKRKAQSLRAAGGVEYEDANRAYLKSVRALSALLKLVQQDKEQREADELREAFFADRWRCSKKILDGEVKVSGASFDKKTCEGHFAKQYSDAQRDQTPSPCRAV